MPPPRNDAAEDRFALSKEDLNTTCSASMPLPGRTARRSATLRAELVALDDAGPGDPGEGLRPPSVVLVIQGAQLSGGEVVHPYQAQDAPAFASTTGSTYTLRRPDSMSRSASTAEVRERQVMGLRFMMSPTLERRNSSGSLLESPADVSVRHDSREKAGGVDNERSPRRDARSSRPARRRGRTPSRTSATSAGARRMRSSTSGGEEGAQVAGGVIAGEVFGIEAGGVDEGDRERIAQGRSSRWLLAVGSSTSAASGPIRMRRVQSAILESAEGTRHDDGGNPHAPLWLAARASATSSSVAPLLLIASSTSPRRTMPISPCRASLGWSETARQADARKRACEAAGHQPRLSRPGSQQRRGPRSRGNRRAARSRRRGAPPAPPPLSPRRRARPGRHPVRAPSLSASVPRPD